MREEWIILGSIRSNVCITLILLWQMENQVLTFLRRANEAALKLATVATRSGEYAKAIEVYEEATNWNRDSAASAKRKNSYFLKAGLCHIIHRDCIVAEQAVARYIKKDEEFACSSECKFLQEVIGSVEEGSEKKFAAILYEYTKRNPSLDDPTTIILEEIKKSMA